MAPSEDSPDPHAQNHLKGQPAVESASSGSQGAIRSCTRLQGHQSLCLRTGGGGRRTEAGAGGGPWALTLRGHSGWGEEMSPLPRGSWGFDLGAGPCPPHSLPAGVSRRPRVLPGPLGDLGVTSTYEPEDRIEMQMAFFSI